MARACALIQGVFTSTSAKGGNERAISSLKVPMSLNPKSYFVSNIRGKKTKNEAADNRSGFPTGSLPLDKSNVVSRDGGLYRRASVSMACSSFDR
jgi:hypothetical protein